MNGERENNSKRDNDNDDDDDESSSLSFPLLPLSWRTRRSQFKVPTQAIHKIQAGSKSTANFTLLIFQLNHSFVNSTVSRLHSVLLLLSFYSVSERERKRNTPETVCFGKSKV